MAGMGSWDKRLGSQKWATSQKDKSREAVGNELGTGEQAP